MRIATYNVHDCIGRDNIYDPLRIIGIVKDLDADIIALQEITLDHAGEILQLICVHTNMHVADGTMFTRGIGRYGNVLLCRNKIDSFRIHELPHPDRELRGVILAQIHWDGMPLRVFATHLGLSRRERRQQIIHLAELCVEGGPPIILMGDLNVWHGGSELKPLTDIGFSNCSERTFPTWPRPLISPDRIMVQQPVAIDTCERHIAGKAKIASDHYPLIAKLSLPS